MDELAFQSGVLTCKGLAYVGADSLVERLCAAPSDHDFVVLSWFSLVVYAYLGLHLVASLLREYARDR